MSEYLRKSRRLPDLPGIKGRVEYFGGELDRMTRMTATVRSDDRADRVAFAQFVQRTGLMTKRVQYVGNPTFVKRSRGMTAQEKVAYRRENPGKMLTPLRVYAQTSYSVTGPWEFLIELCHQDFVVGMTYGEARVGLNGIGNGEEAPRRLRCGQIPDRGELTTYYPAAEKVVVRPTSQNKQTKLGKRLVAENLAKQNEALRARHFRTAV